MSKNKPNRNSAPKQQGKLQLACGLHALQLLLKHRPHLVCNVFIDSKRQQDSRVAAVYNSCQQHSIAVEFAKTSALDKMTNMANHQGVAARYRQLTFTEQDLPRLIEESKQPFFLLLDGVTDVHNLGACLRSANGAGVDAVIIPKHNAAGISQAVSKVASGAAEFTKLISVTNLARTIEQLQAHGVWVYGLADREDASLYEVDLQLPLALVLGSEDKGLRQLTRKKLDKVVAIPMRGQVSSLNVSACAAVAMFEVLRQRIS